MPRSTLFSLPAPRIFPNINAGRYDPLAPVRMILNNHQNRQERLKSRPLSGEKARDLCVQFPLDRHRSSTLPAWDLATAKLQRIYPEDGTAVLISTRRENAPPFPESYPGTLFHLHAIHETTNPGEGHTRHPMHGGMLTMIEPYPNRFKKPSPRLLDNDLIHLFYQNSENREIAVSYSTQDPPTEPQRTTTRTSG